MALTGQTRCTYSTGKVCTDGTTGVYVANVIATALCVEERASLFGVGREGQYFDCMVRLCAVDVFGSRRVIIWGGMGWVVVPVL